MDDPKRERKPLRMISMCIIACSLLLLASCGSATNTSNSTSPPGHSTPTANPNAPPGNFLYTSNAEAMFLAWVNNNNALSGQTQDAQYKTDSSGFLTVTSTHGSFTGTLSNDQVNLNFGGFLGYMVNVTGTYSNNTLTLNIPTKDGGVGTFVFVPATADDFNNAVSVMQTTANNDNATATTLTAESASTATAAVATSYAAQQQQRAVANANQAVANDLSSLQGSIPDFNQAATFDSVFSDYAKGWQQMQDDYQTEVNDAKNGCANGNGVTVGGDTITVGGDLITIGGDDITFNGQMSTINSAYSNIQGYMTNLKNDWQALQTAVANSPSGTPGSNYQQSDIDSAIANGNNALSNADAVVKKAKSERATYDNEANDLNNKAQALPGQMGC